MEQTKEGKKMAAQLKSAFKEKRKTVYSAHKLNENEKRQSRERIKSGNGVERKELTRKNLIKRFSLRVPRFKATKGKGKKFNEY